jgi:protein-tyrosine phosphatase
MIDYHCHLLPGIDDGAKDLAESLEMARILAAHGFREVCCTPHRIRGSFDTTPAQVRAAVASLQAAVDREGIALRLRPGMEYYLDEYLLAALDAPLLLPGGLLLVELPTRCSEEHARETLYQVVRRGFTPLIAHPERSPLLQPPVEPKSLARKIFGPLLKVPLSTHRSSLSTQPLTQHASLIAYLKDLGCRFQGNLGSFNGAYGRQAEARARAMLAQGLYACLGSDGHRPEQLRSILAARSTAEPGVREVLGRTTN